MEFDRFLNLLATSFGAIGSVYTLKGVATLTPDLMERLSRTYWGFSGSQIDAITGQKADAIVGIALVAVAFVIGVVSLAAVPPGVRMFERRGMGVALVAVLCGATYLMLALAGEAIHQHQRLAVGKIITVEALASIFKSGKLPASEVGSVRIYGETLLDLKISDSETPRQILNRVAAAAQMTVPATLDFSEVEPRPQQKQ